MTTTGRYILDGLRPKHCPDLMEWAEWMETADRTVQVTMIGDVRVSTVFLGLDHQFGVGSPILYETMIFGGDLDEYQERWQTLGEAKNGHAVAVQHVRDSMQDSQP